MAENEPTIEGTPRPRSKNTFDDLFRSEYRQVLGLAYVLTGNWSVAEQLTMDGFAAALKNWHQVSILNSPGAWVSKVVSNTAVSRSRRPGAGSPTGSRMPDPPEHFASQSSEVWDAVRRLPKPQAQSIALFYVSGYTRKEIAVMLDISEKSVESWVTTTEVDPTLRDATRDLEAWLGRVPVPAPPTVHRRSSLRVGAEILALGLALGILVVTAPFSSDPTVPIGAPPTTAITPTIPTTTTMPAGSGPVLGPGLTPTGVVLLFNHATETGHDLVAIDVDKGLISQDRLAGLRPGDPPHPMLLVGGSLVAGSGDMYATDLVTRAETHLGQVTMFVPAAEDDRVWMIRYPGGVVGAGVPTVWQVGIDGQQLTEPVELSGPGHPTAGIPGGLALQTDTGLVLWDAGTGEWTRLEEGLSTAWVLDSNPDYLVWCAEPCVEAVFTSMPDLESTRYSIPEGHTAIVGNYGHVSPTEPTLRC